MAYNDEATIRKKKAAALLQRTWWATPPGPTPPHTGKNVLISLRKPTIFVGNACTKSGIWQLFSTLLICWHNWAIFLSCQFKGLLPFGTCLGVQYFVILFTVTICLSSIDTALILLCFLFSRAGESRGGGGNRGLCGSGNGCPTKEDNAMATIALC